jgi:hypothetical protein
MIVSYVCQRFLAAPRCSSLLLNQFRSYRLWKTTTTRSTKGRGPKAASRPKIKNSSSKIVEKVSAILDDPLVLQDATKPKRERGKIAKPLTEIAALQLDASSKGFLEMEATQIQEILNDSLQMDEISSNIIPSSKVRGKIADISDFFEFTAVKLNRDASHADTIWSSSYLEKFYQSLVDEPVPRYTKTSYTQEDLDRFKAKLKDFSGVLQKNEGKFRTQIIRKMNFRRVPRIFFHPDPKLKRLLSELKYKLDEAKNYKP